MKTFSFRCYKLLRTFAFTIFTYPTPADWVTWILFEKENAENGPGHPWGHVNGIDLSLLRTWSVLRGEPISQCTIPIESPMTI